MGVRMALPPVLGIFLTVFIDMLGFGLLIPDLQLRGRELGAVGMLLGLTLGGFSLAQLVTAPFLGRLSDRIGRRRILLLTTLLAVASYVVYAHAGSLWMVMLARALSGVAAANIGVAYAYIADVTTAENRAKGMGLLGAAFGLGFILGPPVGAMLVRAGEGTPLLLGYSAAGLALVNFLYILLVLPESMPEVREGRRPGLATSFRIAFSAPGMALLLLMFFAANLGFTNLEATFFQLLTDPRAVFALSPIEARTAGAGVLLFVGVVMAAMQGGVIRIVQPKFGEVRLLRFAYLLMAPALALVPFAPLWIPMLLVMLAIGIGSGLAQPALSSLISRFAPRDVQGGIFGVTQSIGAVARFTGPLVSNTLFVAKPYYPYLLGALIILIPALGAWRLKMPKEDEAGF
jgi:MFS transporter, DHA1 family, tetracycline resistance protein